MRGAKEKRQVGMLGTGFMGDDKGKRGWHLGDREGEWRQKNLGTPGAVWHTASSVKKETREPTRISLF